jgi:uncharacterized protein (TIRG00374 family)
MITTKQFLSIVVSVSLFAILLTITNPRTVAMTIASVNIFWYLLGVATIIIGYVPATLRWLALQRHVETVPSTFDAFEIIAISYAVNTVLPANSGDLTRTKVAERYHDVTNHAELLSLVAVERLADVLAILLLVSLTMALVTAQLFSPWIVTGSSMILLLTAGLLIKVISSREMISFLPESVLAQLEIASDTVTSLSVGTLLLVQFYSVCRWVLTGLALVFIAEGIGVRVGLPLAIAAVCSMGIMTVLPLSPGGIGAGETAAVTVLVSVGVVESIAVTLALLQRSFGLLWTAPMGLCLYVYRFGFRRK